MKQYRIINNLTGWLVFLVAAVTYCLTVEPTASFWDCPEFITTANKLEVGHPPGAPFFMLTGNFFTQFSSDPSTVAYCVNIMSALLSAFCILFLFWTITHLTRKLVCPEGEVTTLAQMLVVMGAGVTGALAYTWSDTFWYSAVEGEVYAYSSFLTALTFWLILKWEDHADEPHSDRWLILIFYVTGLSIGVHLLNLLCLPAIALVYYYRKNPQAQLKGSLGALCVSALLVVAVLYGVVPGIVKVGGEFEWFFVNVLGMSFNSGMVIYILVLIGVVLAAVWSTTRSDRQLIVVLYTLSVALLGIPFIGHGMKAFVLGLVLLAVLVVALLWQKDGQYLLRKRFLNTSLLCMLVLMIGYSSYAVIVVRSTQNTPMDQNSPEDVFTLGSYLNREQYGDRPLLYGESYTSEPRVWYTQDFANDVTKENYVRRVEKVNPTDPDRYEELSRTKGYVYPSELQMLFPRMHSIAPEHVKAYNSWLGIDPENPAGREGLLADFRDVEFTVTRPDQNGYTYDQTVSGVMPTQWTNLRFFLSYQVNFMYWRYFLWNFAGRQNDMQGNGELEHGNFLTGISFIDNALYGDQDLLPDELKNNKGHNVFYCLPLLLGLIGLFWQAYRGSKGIQQFWVVFFLFFMTGLAIVIYLNQTPLQPRERDYAYAGSFYAFAIWIGLGVAALADGAGRLKEKLGLKSLSPAVVAVVVSLVCLLVPLQMVSQTWDDHDRSGRYACRDFGMNYLSTLSDEGAPIIYTNGDNDTFPLWYAQEVEGFRTDARVCNLSYLNTDWYIDQMRRPAYDSPALPIAWNRYEYVDNKGHDSFSIRNERGSLDEIRRQHPEVNPYELRYLIDNYVRPKGYLPTDSLVVSVNKEAVRNSGMLLPYGPDSIPDYITISLAGKRYLNKSEMMIYEMLSRSDWKRPIYMSVTLGESNYAGLKDYLVLEGLAYRISPFKRGITVDVDKMYDNLMKRFKYGNVNMKGIYLDETVMRMCQTHRHMFAMLARELLSRGDSVRAVEVLRKSKEVLPSYNIPYEDVDYELASMWSQLGQKAEASRVAVEVARSASQYLTWAGSIGYDLLKRKGSRFVRDAFRQLNVLNAVSSISLSPEGQQAVAGWRQKALKSAAVQVLADYYHEVGVSSYNYLVQMDQYLQEAVKQNRYTEEDFSNFVKAYSNLIDAHDMMYECNPALADSFAGIIDKVHQLGTFKMLNQSATTIGEQP